MSILLVVLPTLMLLMFGLGLQLRPADFARLVQRPKAVGVGLACQVFGLPCLALLIAHLLHLPPEYAVGLVLIACCPSGATSNTFTMLAKGDVALAVTLTAFSSLLSVVTIPIAVNLALRHFMHREAAIVLPVGKVMVECFGIVLAPMFLGMWLHLRRPVPAARLAEWLKKASLPLLILMVSVFTAQQFPAIREHAPAMGLAILALVVGGMLLGALGAGLARLDRRESRAIVIEVGLQNAAQAIAIAVSPFLLNDARFAVPAVLYAVVMNLVMLGYLLMLARLARPQVAV